MINVQEKKKYNAIPGLTVILAGEDPASKIYVTNLAWKGTLTFWPTVVISDSMTCCVKLHTASCMNIELQYFTLYSLTIFGTYLKVVVSGRGGHSFFSCLGFVSFSLFLGVWGLRLWLWGLWFLIFGGFLFFCFPPVCGCVVAVWVWVFDFCSFAFPFACGHLAEASEFGRVPTIFNIYFKRWIK